jgi:hypothetical protein
MVLADVVPYQPWKNQLNSIKKCRFFSKKLSNIFVKNVYLKYKIWFNLKFQRFPFTQKIQKVVFFFQKSCSVFFFLA